MLSKLRMGVIIVGTRRERESKQLINRVPRLSPSSLSFSKKWVKLVIKPVCSFLILSYILSLQIHLLTVCSLLFCLSWKRVKKIAVMRLIQLGCLVCSSGWHNMTWTVLASTSFKHHEIWTKLSVAFWFDGCLPANSIPSHLTSCQATQPSSQQSVHLFHCHTTIPVPHGEDLFKADFF